jgi:hypothetical protein
MAKKKYLSYEGLLRFYKDIFNRNKITGVTVTPSAQDAELNISQDGFDYVTTGHRVTFPAATGTTAGLFTPALRSGIEITMAGMVVSKLSFSATTNAAKLTAGKAAAQDLTASLPVASDTQAGILTAFDYKKIDGNAVASMKIAHIEGYERQLGVNLSICKNDGTETAAYYLSPAREDSSGIMTGTQVTTLNNLNTWKNSMPSLAPSLTTGFSGDVTTLQGSSGVSVVSTNGDSVTGLPSDAPSKYGLLFCCGFGTTNQLQVFFSFSHPCYIYSRQKLSGTWRDWCKLVPGTSAASVMSLMDDMGIEIPDATVADDAPQESVNEEPQEGGEA